MVDVMAEPDDFLQGLNSGEIDALLQHGGTELSPSSELGAWDGPAWHEGMVLRPGPLEQEATLPFLGLPDQQAARAGPAASYSDSLPSSASISAPAGPSNGLLGPVPLLPFDLPRLPGFQQLPGAAAGPSWGAVPSGMPGLVPGAAAQPPLGHLFSELQREPGQGGPAAAAAPEQPRRRGRKPRDAALLTDKQLRIREQNRRFEAKQRAKAQEAEESLGAAAAELERERAQAEAAKLTASMLELALEYKTEVLGALSAAGQADPSPGIAVPPALAEVLERERVFEDFTVEELTRYPVGGWTAHVDESGRVKEAPPFEAVARDWADIVNRLQLLLEEGRMSGRSGAGALAGGSQGALGAAAPGAVQQRGEARESAPGEVVELPGGCCSRQGSGEAGQPSAPGAAAAAALSTSTAGATSAGSNAQASSDSGGGAAAAGGGLAGQPSGSSLTEQGSESKEGGGAASLASPSERSQEGSDFSGGLEKLWPQGMPCGIKRTPPEILERGMEAKHGDEWYQFTGPQLKEIALLLRRTGLLCWQQVTLFPENANRLVACRLDTLEVCIEQEELPRWQGVLRALRLRRDQLQQLAALHRRFMNSLRPALEERRAALARLGRLRGAAGSGGRGSRGSRGRGGGGDSRLDGCWQGAGGGAAADPLREQGVNGAAAISLALFECNAALARTVDVLNAAISTLTVGLFNLLDFPLQEAKLTVLSWPFYPQLHLLGIAAAIELGLDLAPYQAFTELYTQQAGPVGGAGAGTELTPVEAGAVAAGGRGGGSEQEGSTGAAAGPAFA